MPTARSGLYLLEIPVLLVTKKDLLDLASINPNDPFMGHLGTCVFNIDVMYIALKINSLSVRVSVIHRGDMKCWSSQSGAGYLLWLFLAL